MRELAAGPAGLDDYDVVLINTSGGKDSQAMLAALVGRCDAEGIDRSRIVVVHADLGRLEWPGTRALAQDQAAAYGLRFEVVSRGRDLFHQIEHERRKFPSSAARYCTSDHKTSQVLKLITRLVGELDPVRLGRRVRILNCLGMRAQESPGRAKRPPFSSDPASWAKPKNGPRKPHGKRQVDRWLPIHHWSTEDVWGEIDRSGLPHHPAYDLGMTRLSCVFCVLASRDDLLTAVRHNRALAEECAAVEQRIGHRFTDKCSMADLIRLADSSAMHATQGPRRLPLAG